MYPSQKLHISVKVQSWNEAEHSFSLIYVSVGILDSTLYHVMALGGLQTILNPQVQIWLLNNISKINFASFIQVNQHFFSDCTLEHLVKYSSFGINAIKTVLKISNLFPGCCPKLSLEFKQPLLTYSQCEGYVSDIHDGLHFTNIRSFFESKCPILNNIYQKFSYQGNLFYFRHIPLS